MGGASRAAVRFAIAPRCDERAARVPTFRFTCTVLAVGALSWKCGRSLRTPEGVASGTGGWRHRHACESLWFAGLLRMHYNKWQAFFASQAARSSECKRDAFTCEDFMVNTVCCEPSLMCALICIHGDMMPDLYSGILMLQRRAIERDVETALVQARGRYNVWGVQVAESEYITLEDSRRILMKTEKVGCMCPIAASSCAASEVCVCIPISPFPLSDHHLRNLGEGAPALSGDDFIPTGNRERHPAVVMHKVH
eukprot:1928773-Amphidinium_carterae.1